MSDAPSLSMVDRPQLNLLDRAMVWSSWLLAGVLFLTVGWSAMKPDDPVGAVSLLTRSGAIVMLIQATALAAVAAALATLLAGRKLADVGTFSAALGLAAVSLRGGTVQHLLMQRSDGMDAPPQSLAILFALEAVAWFTVLVITVGVSGWLVRWCLTAGGRSEESRADTASLPARTMSALDIPGIGVGFFGQMRGCQTSLGMGVGHTLLTTFFGLAAFYVLSTGTASRTIQHGQECFVVTAAVWAGCYAAHRLRPVRSALWSILAVGMMAVAGYVWSSLGPGSAGTPITVPGSPFMRILPIQFVSVGTAAAVVMFWHMYVPQADTRPGDTSGQ